MLAALLRQLVSRRRGSALGHKAGVRRLHLGCGTDIRSDWINLDARKLPGVDVVADLDDCRDTLLPFPNDSIDEFLGSHVLEHLRDPLALMQELHRIAKPGAVATFRVPYGSSDDADEDPTHVRRFFLRSFSFFSQVTYTRADYGYRGDWRTTNIVLTMDSARHGGKSPDELFETIRTQRNAVVEMIATLRAVKPARVPGGTKADSMSVAIEFLAAKDSNAENPRPENCAPTPPSSGAA
jgi:SAM-dependent methyltransferase